MRKSLLSQNTVRYFEEQMYSKYDDLEPEHRELLVPFGSTGYVLLYRVDQETALVTVLFVRHQKEAG